MVNSILIAVVVMLFWALSMFFTKVAVDKIGIPRAIFWTVVAYLITDVSLFLFLLNYGVSTKVELYNWASILAGIFAFGGYIAFYWLLQRTKVSIAVPLTALYPAITVVLAVLVLKEKIKLVNAAGVLLAIAAAVLLSL